MKKDENEVIAFPLLTGGSRGQEQFVAGCGHKLTSCNLKGGITYRLSSAPACRGSDAPKAHAGEGFPPAFRRAVFPP